MGFNRRHLPELEELKKIREKFETPKDFIKFIVGKSEVLTGPSESHRYLDEIWEDVKKSESDEGCNR
jgi:hypothetical protein